MADFWSDLDNRVQQQAAQGANHNWSAWQARLDSQQAQQPTKKKKGFWQDQISTGGSIAGALGGAAAGTAILPGVGTLIGALLGGAAGGAGGQAAENAVVGDELGKDVLSEALWGGATALPFGAVGKLGKAGMTVAKGAGSQAAKTAAMDLVNQAAVKTMPSKTLTQALAKGSLPQGMQDAAKAVTSAPTLSQKLGQRLTGAADDFAIKQFRFTPTQLTNFGKKFGEDAGQTVRKYGFNSAEDIAVKGIDPLQEQFGALVNGIGTIPTATIKDNLENSVKKLATSAASDNQAVAKQVQAEAKNLLKRFGSTVDANELNTIRREFDSLVNYTQSVANPSRYSVNKRVADVLRSTLQQADTTGKLKGVGQEISKLRSLSELALKQDNLGRGSQPASMLALLGGAMGGGAAGIPGMLTGVASTAVVNSPLAKQLVSDSAGNLSKMLLEREPKDIGQTLKQAAARIGIAGTIHGTFGPDQRLRDLSLPGNQNASTTAANTANISQNIPSQYPEQQQMSSPLGVSSAEIGQALMRAYVAGDAPAIKQLQGMYELASQFEEAQAPKQKAMGVEAVKNMNNAQTGLQSLNDLEAMINNDSSLVTKAAAPDVAILNGLMGTSQYRAAIKNVQDAMSRLRSGASMTEQESARFDKMLPSIGDDPQTVQYKIQQFRDYFGSYLQNPGTSSTQDLASALAAS